MIDFICGEYYMICLSESKKVFGWGQGIAGIFDTMQDKYPIGSDLTCNTPRELSELDTAHRFIILKQRSYAKLHQKGILSKSFLSDDSDFNM